VLLQRVCASPSRVRCLEAALAVRGVLHTRFWDGEGRGALAVGAADGQVEAVAVNEEG
jgi:hypothetical protein